jgi:hypothetical protein
MFGCQLKSLFFIKKEEAYRWSKKHGLGALSAKRNGFSFLYDVCADWCSMEDTQNENPATKCVKDI